MAVEETQCPWEDRGTQGLATLATTSQFRVSAQHYLERVSDSTLDHCLQSALIPDCFFSRDHSGVSLGPSVRLLYPVDAFSGALEMGAGFYLKPPGC